MTRSIHDNVVVGYEVDIEAKTVVLHTVLRSGDDVERTDVRFEGVLGYLLLDAPLTGSILLDIEEVPFADFFAEYEELFKRENRYYWPFGSEKDPAVFVASRGATTFSIQPSLGLSGYVVCDSMTLIAM